MISASSPAGAIAGSAALPLALGVDGDSSITDISLKGCLRIRLARRA